VSEKPFSQRLLRNIEGSLFLHTFLSGYDVKPLIKEIIILEKLIIARFYNDTL